MTLVIFGKAEAKNNQDDNFCVQWAGSKPTAHKFGSVIISFNPRYAQRE